MKKNYLFTLLLFVTGTVFSQMGQIPNGGFENWSMSTLYDYPTQWGNSNSDEWRGVQTVIQSTDAPLGSYSAELTSAIAPGTTDTLSPYVYHGTVGQSGPDGGISYTDLFDEVRFQYTGDMQNDTLYMIYMRFVSTTMVEMNILYAASGTSGVWNQGSISVPSTPQDELFIGFILGNPFNGPRPQPGAWVRIDDVQLHNLGTEVTDLPDPSFEQWSSQQVEVADNWNTLNEMLAGEGIENANKTTDANSGSFAVEMTTVQNMYGDTIPSFVSWGPINFAAMGNPFMPVPYNATPTTFSGAYKYAPQNGDQANIQVLFLQGGTPIGSHFETISAAASYQTFTAPLTITGTPDSVVLVAFSGDNPGSVLLLDDLSFSGGDVSIEEFEKMSVSLYPNPSTEYVMVKSDGVYNLTFIDLAGNVVYEKNNLSGAQNVNISELSRGAYIVKIINDGQMESLRFIKE